MADRMLVNFFYAHQLGHAIEALHYAHGHQAADPGREMHVALSGRTPVELATWAPFVTAAYGIDHPFLEDEGAPFPAAIPREGWDWVLDDGRRYQDHQLRLFPGMRRYYATADRELSTRDRSFTGSPRAGYVPHTALRLTLPGHARAAAAAKLGGARAIAVLPGGSGPAAQYPSVASWTFLAGELRRAHPGTRIVLVGKLAADARSSTGSRGSVEALRAGDVVDAVDLPLAEQLALVERCGAFLSPHTGFGLAALAVGTPWLTISGGRWFEYYFNHVPFRSVVADPRWQADPLSDGRIREDADRILTAAGELLDGTLDYQDALADYYRDLTRVVAPEQIWSIDGVHERYV